MLTHADAAEAEISFGRFRLDASNARLTDGQRAIELVPKAFAVLCHLAARPQQLVTKEQLLDAVWGRRFVSESVLKNAVNAIRSALGDDSRQPRYVETVSRRGYRFIGDSATAALPRLTADAPPAPATVAELACPTHPRHCPVLIGRRHAVDQLEAWRAHAVAGQRQMVLVGGDAGIGKSTLVQVLLAAARTEGQAVAVGQCVEQAGGGEPYLPILDALAELARGPAAAVWLAGLRQAAPTWLAQLPWLASEADQARLRRELAGAAQDRMLREFVALLDVVTPQHPLLLVIEDLHWSDHATVSLLDFMARRRGPARWMVVASFRPTDVVLSEHPMQALRHELRMHKLCHEVLLEPFSEREVDAYLRHHLGVRWIAQHEALARALHVHTDGLPLFLANVLDDLDQGGPALDDACAWADPAATLARLQLPDTVVGIVERQISRLPGPLRDALEAASVVGLEFTHPLLAAVLGQGAETLRSHCDGLARRGEWLRVAGMALLPNGALGNRYAFRHALYRRVCYERSDPARRIQWHLCAAESLLTLVGSSREPVAADLAQHYEGARDTAAAAGTRLEVAAQQAAHWRLRAARAAVAVHAPADAIAHFGRLNSADQAPAERVAVLAECADLHQKLGHGEQALAHIAAALSAAQDLSEPGRLPNLLPNLLLQRADLAQQNDMQHQAMVWIDELLAMQPPQSPQQQARALLVKAAALGCIGQLDAADTVTQAALECLPVDALAERAKHFAGRVAVHFQRGTFAQGHRVAVQAFELYEQIGDAVGAATMVGRRGVFAMVLARPEEAEAALLEARARTCAPNDVQGQRSALLNLVKLRSDRGDTEGALALLNEGMQLAPAFESPVTESAFLSGFHYCNYLRGNLGAALNDAERLLDIAQGLSSVYWRIGAQALVAVLYIHLGSVDVATGLIDRAMLEAGARDVHHLWPKLATYRAWLDLLAGSPEKALISLDAMRDSDDVFQLEDLAVMARVRAQAQLALGDAPAALEALAGFDGAPTLEAWALMLAVRLRAQCRLGKVRAVDLERAGRELADSRMPALEGVVLRQSLGDALIAAGQPEAAMAHALQLAEQRSRLVASLAGAPAHMVAAVASLGTV